MLLTIILSDIRGISHYTSVPRFAIEPKLTEVTFWSFRQESLAANRS